MMDKAPIIARASAAGKGGIGILRISGRFAEIEKLTQRLFPETNLEARRASLLAVRDEDGALIDQAIVILFKGPHSYTGETVLEIQGHGGPAVQKLIMDRCLHIGRSLGLRLAEPGEFTQRAFLNNRIDLAQAEAVADLIDASSERAAKSAARSMQGDFSKKVRSIYEKLIELRAYVEATLDFPEEEIEFIEGGRIAQQTRTLLAEMENIERSAMRGKVLRDGLSVVLVGAPNVGKSSLMNALAGEDVAIVTEIAGTTRDKIEREITVDGLPLKLIDTAGVRHASDKVEQIGIERTLEAVESADVVLHLTDAARPGDDEEKEAMQLIQSRLRAGVTFLNIKNKTDLLEGTGTSQSDAEIFLSAKTGQGMDELFVKLKELSGLNETPQGEFSARARHLDCIARAKEHLCLVCSQIGAMTLDIAAEELRLAAQAMGQIVGQTLPDEILGMIFSRFCIGK